MKRMLQIAAVLALAGPAWPQGSAPSAGGSPAPSYQARQKARLQKALERRLDSMRKRFEAAQNFRQKQELRREAMEKNLMREREAFVEAVLRLHGEARGKAWDGFYLKQRHERQALNQELRLETRKFYESLYSM